MKKFYIPAVIFTACLFLMLNEGYAQHNFYVSTSRNLSTLNTALCNGTGSNSCNFYVGWDGSTNYLSNITLSADANCDYCTFYSVNSTDKIVLISNVTFTNTSLVGANLVINGYTLTLGSNLSVNTGYYTNVYPFSLLNNVPNSNFNSLASTIVIGNTTNHPNSSSINLNGNDININAPITGSNNSTITLGETNSSVYDNTSGHNGDITYNYNFAGFGYISSKNMFSADGGSGTNGGTSPVPYTNLGSGHYELVGASTTSINGSSSIFVSITPLPVVLVDFQANLKDDGTVALSWATEQELNSSYFEVQRSADGSTWDGIGKVQAQGNSSLVTNYSYNDPNPIGGVGYYRLQMVDLDGRYTYSEVKVVRSTSTQSLSVFPNPAKTYVNVFLGKAATSDLTVKLINANGQIVQSKILGAGGTNISLLVNNYPAGVYLLHITGANGSVQTSKVIISRQ